MHIEVCQYLIEQIANYADYLNKIITANKMLIYCYDPMFEQQMREWVPWGSSHPLKPHAIELKIKCIVITFFDQEGLVYTHAVPEVKQSMWIGTLKS